MMRLIYTNIRQNLTKILTKEAVHLSEKGKRVFYIAPSSLSFEKERQVLSYLKQRASLDIIVTRFTQMARYLTLTQAETGETIDDLGLSMIFYRVLKTIDAEDLNVYGHLRQNIDFVKELVSLYKELQESRLHITDLTELDSVEKQADLQRIFHDFYKAMEVENYQTQSKINQLTQAILSGQLKEQLDQMALVVDGFTRFSAEEMALLSALNSQGVEILIATYASQEAYRATYISGNLYQAGVDFLRELSQRFAVKPEYISLEASADRDALARISTKLASHYDFSLDTITLEDDDRKALTIWEVISQKEEVLHVAKQIRYHLQKGYRYKDILVLLGDVDSYHLQIGKIFDRYDIPYYLAKEESMGQHPLVNVIDALIRIKTYHFQADDVLNLLKTGLYGHFDQEELDRFEQYLYFAQIKGVGKFSRDFTLNYREKFDLPALNQFRQNIIQPLVDLLQVRPQSGKSLLKKITKFLSAAQINTNLATLSSQGSEIDLEQARQVWQLFTTILHQFQELFAKEKLKIEDCLTLIRSGMLGASFRTIPATVDVVNVKAYDLISPHTNKLVFAIGLTQSHFPKVFQNTSLISDKERLNINNLAGQNLLEVPRREQSKRSHFTALSLLNSATEHLVLSAPQIFTENEETMSPYLLQLCDLGIPKLEKGKATFETGLADIGNYKGLLASLIELNRQEIDNALDGNQQTFWSVAVRYLRKKLAKQGLVIPQISANLHSQPLSSETLQVLYPQDKALHLSASSLTDFYNSEYKYYLKHVLGLQENPSILPDARVHGNFLHKVFETILKNTSSASFDQKINQALFETSQLPEFQLVYQENSQGRFSHKILTDIARATATVLRDEQLLTVEAEEAAFRETIRLNKGRLLTINGKIDRIDRLLSNQAYGVVDYKSSRQAFKLSQFYNGLSPQLPTYLLAMTLKNQPDPEQKLFGAMYLHMTDPITDLNKVKKLEELLKQSQNSLTFKGLFLKEASEGLTSAYGKTSLTTFTQDELATILNYTTQLYQKAAERILAGHFAINPYSDDQRSVSGEQYKSITHFESDLHLGNARFLARLGRKKEDWIKQMKGEQDEI